VRLTIQLFSAISFGFCRLAPSIIEITGRETNCRIRRHAHNDPSLNDGAAGHCRCRSPPLSRHHRARDSPVIGPIHPTVAMPSDSPSAVTAAQ